MDEAVPIIPAPHRDAETNTSLAIAAETEDPTLRCLRAITGSVSEGYLAILELPNAQHRHFHVTELEPAAAYLKEASARRRQVYLKSNIQGSTNGTKAASVCRLAMVSVDFDLAGPGHKSQSLPTKPEDFGMGPSPATW
jgi:hypothetical protein